MNFQSRLKITLRRARTIREWLALLVISCILPATIATMFLIQHFYQHERASVERTTIATARALMQAVDRELFSAQGTLQALATSPLSGVRGSGWISWAGQGNTLLPAG